MTKAELTDREPTPERKTQFMLALHDLYVRDTRGQGSSGFELPEIVDAVCRHPSYRPNTLIGRGLRSLGYNPDNSVIARRAEVAFLGRSGVASAAIGGLVEDGVVNQREIAWALIEENYGHSPLEDGRLYTLPEPPVLAETMLSRLLVPEQH